MQKILLITPELEYTGALNSFKRICQVLLNNGYFVDIWSYNEGPYIREFDKLGIYVEIIDEDLINIDWIHRRIFKYSLVIANTVVVYKAVELIEKYVPLVWYIREAENLPDFFWKKGRLEALKKAKKLYVVSEYAKDFIVKNYNENVEVLHNCVDDVYKSVRIVHNNISLKLKEKNSKLKFLTLGTIEKRKGYDILLQAFTSLPDDIRKECELHFAGRFWEGASDFYPQILNQARQHSNIFYHGELRDRENIHQLIKYCDVIVVPSRDESCSLVALEGAMMAKALILTQNIGAKYILNSENGWLVETANMQSLKNAFIQAYTSKNNLKIMGEKAREAYLKTSTYEIYEKNILKMVRENICYNQYLYQIQQKNFSLFSFDVFDTLISRKVAQPQSIFLIVKERLKSENLELPPVLIENFDYIRVQIEQYFYINICSKKNQDVTFDEIYKVIQDNFNLTENQKRKIMDLEIQTEKEYLYPIVKNIKLVENLIKSNKRVILISDMYFNSELIRNFLIHFSDIFKEIPIYVSSEYKRKKHNGKLFKIVFSLEKIKPENWIHCGDNYEHDILQARKLGIEVNFYENMLLPYEQYTLEHNSNLNLQKIIALSRKIRNEYILDNLQEIGVSLGGPLLAPYVYWILEIAKKNKIKSLYFIARDGFILQQIANIFIAKESLNIEVKYLEGSREAWREPFKEKNDKKINLIKEYLKQELDLSKKFAFVEFCGTGETLDYIIKETENLDHNKCFFGSFYLYRTSLFKTYSPSLFLYPINRSNIYYLELFARSLEGQTLSYDKIENKIIPIKDKTEGEALKEFGYEKYINGVLQFVQNLVKLENYNHLLYDLSIISIYFKYLLSEGVDKKMVDILGSIPFILNGKSEKIHFFSPRIIDNEKIEKNLSLWTILRSDSQIRKIYHIDSKNVKFFGAVAIVKSHLSYRLGNVVLLNSKNPIKILKLIFLIPSIIIAYKEEKKIIKNNEKKIDLQIYKDYEEAVVVKNFFSYQLGEIILKTFKTYNLIGIFILPFKIRSLYKNRIRNKKKEKNG
ncbi:HAD-IA family hydrolase [Campylobacter sp. W0065]|uniref:HAD-IA family hydrolase n=1 Tax=Campylobacter molothri TaxID=1032242 RepID=UPI00301E60B5|nr:HAD-IA family hydrolase [Campylobacter sp. W0065]